MKSQLTREDYLRIHSNYTYTEYPEVNLLIGVDEKSAICFGGKRSKPDWHYSFRSNERRDEKIKETIESAQKTLEYKAQRKAENKGCLSGSAATAVEIRKALKKCFPGTKFSVRSETFSMRNSVDVSWTDGPMKSLVESVIDLFAYGRFDSMQDLSYSVDIDPRLDCSGVKYVHANRDLSPAYRLQLETLAEQRYFKNEIGYFAPWQMEFVETELVYHDELFDTSLTVDEWLPGEKHRLRELVLGSPIEKPADEILINSYCHRSHESKIPRGCFKNE